jgi:hypothetical protein
LQTESRGQASGIASRVWAELEISSCDFSRTLDSGFNLYIAENGTCDTLTCVLEETSIDSSCAPIKREPAYSSRNLVQHTHLELVSFSPDPDFDPTKPVWFCACYN